MTFKYEGEGWYETRDGGKAYVAAELPNSVCSVDGVEIYVGYLEGGGAEGWYADGRVFEEIDAKGDLIRKLPEKKTLWVNVDDDGFTSVRRGRYEADKFSNHDRIARIKVEYEEGQFDE